MVAEQQQQLSALMQSVAGASAAQPPAAVAAGGGGGAASAEALQAPLTAGECANPVLSILGYHNGLLSVSCQGILRLNISAYQIDTELLFTTVPFSCLTSSGTESSGSMDNAGHGGAVNRGGNGLGKVAYVKPSATLAVQLMAEHQQQGVQINSPPSNEACLTCVLDVDMLMPELAAQSVLLEVTGGGITRTLPR